MIRSSGAGRAGSSSPGGDGPAACAAALAALPGMGPATLYRLIAGTDPEEVWRAVLDGRVTRPQGRGRRIAAAAGAGRVSAQGVAADGGWARAAAGMDPAGQWVRYQASGIQVTWRGQPDYPSALVEDPEPPGVLFWRGDIKWLDRKCVAIVGTRRCTPDGRITALSLGRDLAAAGVCVVSGLALGIDGAAHAGALDADATGPVAVVASGVDRPYPPQHRDLWQRVARAGAVMSETPPGAPAQAWRFPARNRIIAGLSDLVVVVESHAAGGALLTADAAIARGVDVRAVPGPVRSPASAGTNQLLCDGPGPVRHAQDVLDMLSLIRPGVPRRAALPGRGIGMAPGSGMGPAPGPGADGSEAPALLLRPQPRLSRMPPAIPVGDAADHRRAEVVDEVLDAVSHRPVTVGRIVARTGLDLGIVARELDCLEAQGKVTSHGDWWARLD